MTEWNAAEYTHISELQATMAAEALALLDLKGSERILDIGCGDGRITAAVAARVPTGSVLGVDASQDMIQFAAKRFAGSPGSNLQFAVADAGELGFRNEFDLVISFNALHWVTDQAAALRSIRTALKSSGQARLRLVPKGARKSLEDVIEETRCSAKWAPSFTSFRDPYLHLTPEEYRVVAESCGLQVRALDTEDKAWDFKSRDAFFAFGSVTFVAWTRLLPETEKPAFILDVLDRYQAVAAETPGEEFTFKFYQMNAILAPA